MAPCTLLARPQAVATVHVVHPRGHGFATQRYLGTCSRGNTHTHRHTHTHTKKKKRPCLAPYFLLQPHLPHIAPKKYFDLYPLEDVALPSNKTRRAPEEAPEIAWNSCSEMLSYKGVSGTRTHALQRLISAPHTYTQYCPPPPTHSSIYASAQ